MGFRAEPGKQKTRSCRTQELAWGRPSRRLYESETLLEATLARHR
jgi:hypothetical protein